MKKYILAIACISSALTLSAQNEILRITFNDGTKTTLRVADIAEMTFGTDEQSATEGYTGSFTGTNSVVVGGQFTYTADMTCNIVADGETLTVEMPEYKLAGTVMGDLTLGACTITGITYDESRQAFHKVYGEDGLTQHFKAENGGVATMNKDYTFSKTSNITIEKTADGLIITNSFQLGAMPFPIVATFSAK